MRLFIKSEPHPKRKADTKAWRLIFSIGLVDQLAHRLIFDGLVDHIVSQWPYGEEQLGIGFSDDQVRKSMENFLSHMSPGDHCDWDDASSWDWSFNECDSKFAELHKRSIYSLPSNEDESIAYQNWLFAVSGVYQFINNKVIATSDGFLYPQDWFTAPGIMPSGFLLTASDNSTVRAQVEKNLARTLGYTLRRVETMGDDCKKITSGAPERSIIQDLALRWGKRLQFAGTTQNFDESKGVAGFEFCSHHWFIRNGEYKAVPEWPKMLYNYLGKKDSSDLYYSLLFELRHLDSEVLSLIKHFLKRAGRGVFNITQSMATSKKHLKKEIKKKDIKKEVAKDVRKLVVRDSLPRAASPNAHSYFARSLMDPFGINNAKVPDMNTQPSACARSVYWTPVFAQAEGMFALCFDPVNPAAWLYTGTVSAGAVITWPLATGSFAVPNYTAMASASAQRRLVSAGLCFVPTASSTTITGTVSIALSPSPPVTGSPLTGTISLLNNMMSVYRSSPTNSVRALWGPVDYDSFTYYTWPGSGTSDVPVGDNKIYISGNGCPPTVQLGVILFVANYEVIVTNESSSILPSTPSPADMNALQFAANSLMTGGNIQGATYYGGAGDQMMKMKQDALFGSLQTMAGNSANHMVALRDFASAHNPSFRFARN